MQNFTRMGRYIFAIGGNLQAAIVSGVRTKTYLVLAYVICSMLASVSGLALTAQIGSGQAVISSQLTLESIAAAVIAGVSLKGGVGRVEMVTLAAFFLLILTDAMDLLQDRSAHPDDLPRDHRRAGGGGGRDGQAEDARCLTRRSLLAATRRKAAAWWAGRWFLSCRSLW